MWVLFVLQQLEENRHLIARQQCTASIPISIVDDAEFWFAANLQTQPHFETLTTIIELIILANADPKGEWFTKQIAKPVFTHELGQL